MDAKYLLTGSDDTNIRLWKANASEKLGPLSFREKGSADYQDTLKKRFKNLPEIRRIARHRHIPKPLYKAAQKKKTMLESIHRKEENERKHTKPGTMPHKGERKKHIVKVAE
jgi:WD repeat and SOF domain-containing protein 1